MSQASPLSSSRKQDGEQLQAAWKVRLAATCLFGLLRCLHATLRIEWEGDEHQLEATREGPAIYVAWHGNQLPLFVPLRGRNRTLLISQSRDGELLSLIVKWLGFRTVRGSSTRGGTEAAASLLEELHLGRSALLAVDGPRGPERQSRPGAVRLAALTGRPILPVGIAGRGIYLPTWDRFFIPYPFSRLVIRRGRPISIEPAGCSGPGLKHGITCVDAALDALDVPVRSGVPGRAGRLMSGDELPSLPGMINALYLILIVLVGPLLSLMLLAVAVFRKSWRLHFRERLGFYPFKFKERSIWVHAASLGEVGVARSLLGILGVEVRTRSILTTTTTAGRSSALTVGAAAALLAPLDLAGPLFRAYRRLDPQALILIETELWPGLLWLAKRRGIPVIVVNGCISECSFQRFHRWRTLYAPLLSDVHVAARSAGDAARFRALGVQVEHCRVFGDVKSLSSDQMRLVLDKPLLRWLKAGPTLIAASIHPGEASIVYEAVKALWGQWPELRLVLAPRHPELWLEREEAFHNVARRSQFRSEIELPDRLRLIVLDTLGELSSLYPFAFAVFVGGTLVSVGGHNLLEVAHAGRMILYGPSLEQVKEQAEMLEKSGAGWKVSGVYDLEEALRWSLSNPEATVARGEGGRSVVAAQGRIADALRQQVLEWLNISGTV